MLQINFRALIPITVTAILLSIGFSNQADCNLRMATSEHDLITRNNMIFDAGSTLSNWSLDSPSHYVSEYFKTIDYFYIMEQKLHKHEDIIVRNNFVIFRILILVQKDLIWSKLQ